MVGMFFNIVCPLCIGNTQKQTSRKEHKGFETRREQSSLLATRLHSDPSNPKGFVKQVHKDLSSASLIDNYRMTHQGLSFPAICHTRRAGCELSGFV